jgi:hypothetical protein
MVVAAVPREICENTRNSAKSRGMSISLFPPKMTHHANAEIRVFPQRSISSLYLKSVLLFVV